MLPAEFPAWDPVLFDFPGPIDVRYYGLMYVLGFAIGQLILIRLAKARFLAIDSEKVADFVFYLLLGVILGGRLGYWAFYDSSIPIYAVWKGGLSFHGGLIGVTIASYLFARKHKVPFLRLADAATIAGTPGVFFVRMANFINGELYGRITDAATWGAMQFPTDPVARGNMKLHLLDGDKRLEELAVQTAYGDMPIEDFEALLPESAKAFSNGRPIPWEELLDWKEARVGVPHRHPSQLYEGFGEGVLIGLILFALYWLTRAKPLKRGAYFGTFLCGYAIVRFCIEFVRQPDSQFRDKDDDLGTVLMGFTMGQTLCAAMFVGGVYLLLRKASNSNTLDPSPADAGKLEGAEEEPST